MVVRQETGEVLDQLLVGRQRCGGRNVLGDLFRVAGPAQQAFKLQPANAKEAVGHRVLNRPCRRAILARRGLMQAQVFAQRRQGGGSGAVHYQPVHSRTVASGRRSR